MDELPCTQGWIPIATAIESGNERQPAVSAINEQRSGRRNITPNKKFGIARKGRSQTFLAELLCALGLPYDYRYLQPGNLKLAMRVCHFRSGGGSVVW